MTGIDNFLDDDLVFHYTKGETALNHILSNGTLRFSKFAKVCDPSERLYGTHPVLYRGSFWEGEETAEHDKPVHDNPG